MANKTEFYVSAAKTNEDAANYDYANELRLVVGSMIPNFDSVTAAQQAEDPAFDGQITYLKVTVEQVGEATRADGSYVFVPFDTEGRD